MNKTLMVVTTELARLREELPRLQEENRRLEAQLANNIATFRKTFANTILEIMPKSDGSLCKHKMPADWCDECAVEFCELLRKTLRKV
jgi:hypothetical protein